MNNDCADEEGSRHNLNSHTADLEGWIPAMTRTRRQQNPSDSWIAHLSWSKLFAMLWATAYLWHEQLPVF